MAEMLRKLFLMPLENEVEEETESAENLQRNQNRVDQLDYVPDSFESQTISQIVERNEGTSDNQDHVPDRNIFKMLQDMEMEIKAMHQTMQQSHQFRVEGQIKRDIAVVAKRYFGRNMFSIPDACKTEVSELIQEEMGRQAKISEIKKALSFVKRKYSTEYRPAIYRTLRATMEQTKEKQLRSLFGNYTDASTADKEVVDYRKQMVLIMRFLHRENPPKGTFWRKVEDLHTEIEGKEKETRLSLYQGLLRREEREQ
ncbi:uncharacterized protein LOC127717230 [Mytilus californianus]|uniref:uncharacterized protein LOC127713061 n=1 Tax=Mytilus californianus TaxID=6549 RepID=UPI0022474895|nr:uncharacterized protein LOC127713061 [Mytilus californianus]XP_052078942.1 uncharacterized protein LOC127717230 [Mytilus californianus]